jgi:hypothetical protein
VVEGDGAIPGFLGHNAGYNLKRESCHDSS